MAVTIEQHIKACEKSVEIIAHVRRMAELDDTDMEEFDKALNALCDKYHDKFAKMDDLGVALYGMKVILEAGEGEKLMRILTEDEGDE